MEYKLGEKMKFLYGITITIILLFSGCTTKLTKDGAKVIKLKKNMIKNCKYIDMVRASESGGLTSEDDANGVINQIKNKVAKLGGDAYFPTKGRVGLFGANAIVDAYKCNTNNKINQNELQSIIKEIELENIKDNNIIIGNEKKSIIRNQKYGCANVGSYLGNKYTPQKDMDMAFQYPRRFYIDDKNILYTDNGENHNFLRRIKNDSIAYSNQSSLISVMIVDNDILMSSTVKSEFGNITLIYQCMKTNNWTLGK